MDNDIYKKHMKGTTTVGIVCSDGVVVGADSRATMDTFIASTEARKVWKIDSTVAMTIAGSVGDAQELIRMIKAQNEIYKMNENHPMSPKSAASLLSIVMQQNKMIPFMVQLIIAGVDSGRPQLYSMDPIGGYNEESKFTATGSGSITALGYLEEMYKEGISTKEAIKMAARAITIAMRRDSATGNNMTIATVTKSGYTEYGAKEIERIASAK